MRPTLVGGGEVAVARGRDGHEAEVEVVDRRRVLGSHGQLGEELLAGEERDEAVDGGEEHRDEQVDAHGAVERVEADDGVLDEALEDGDRRDDDEQDGEDLADDRRRLVVADEHEDDRDEGRQRDQGQREAQDAPLDLRGAQGEPGGRREDDHRHDAAGVAVARGGDHEVADDEQQQDEPEAVGEARRLREEPSPPRAAGRRVWWSCRSIVRRNCIPERRRRKRAARGARPEDRGRAAVLAGASPRLQVRRGGGAKPLPVHSLRGP